MAVHINMSEEAEQSLKKAVLRNKLSSLAACIGFLLVGAFILYGTVIFIENVTPPAFETYVEPASDAPPTKKPKVKELSSSSSSSSQVAPSVIISTNSAPVAMAEVDIPSSDIGIGTSTDIGFGLGTGGLGDGLGTGGSGLGSSEAGGSALEGTFYDLKLTKAGASTGVELNEDDWIIGEGLHLVTKRLSEFIQGNWQKKYLDKYYQSPTKLYASTFVFPESKASYAPIAFKADKKVKPCGWVIVYRGKVRAPKTGKFRFIGNGDDLVAVKFNNKMVLEAGYVLPSFYKPDMTNCFPIVAKMGENPEYKNKISTYPGRSDYVIYPESTPGWWNNLLGGLTGGNVFSVQEGKEYPIEILYSEVPGGQFAFVLLIEDLSTKRTKDGEPVFDLFRTNFATPNMQELVEQLKKDDAYVTDSIPDYNDDSPIWTVVP